MKREYMRTRFFLSKFAIALWDPSPNMNLSPQLRERNIQLGDVGYFNMEGGFDILFNIFTSTEKNIDLFDPPPQFVPYIIPSGMQMDRRNHITARNYIPSSGPFVEEQNSDGYVGTLSDVPIKSLTLHMY